ncbi:MULTISPECIES: glycosyltransferase [Microbacterium]|uniref:glycosyltransferase n=1 Tax=Microbacterium TaxID=33882 RepID=UPI00344B910A
MTPTAETMRVVQLYEVVRTAHLERAAAMMPRPVILYRRTRYDFDPALAHAVDAQRRSLWGMVVFALTTDIDVIEVNEPLAGDSSLPSVAFAAGARLRAAARGRTRPLVVSYAIENLEPATLIRNLPVKARWRHRLRHLTTPLLWRWLDRIVYGTAGAQSVYATAFARSAHRPLSRLIEALPAAIDGVDAPREREIVFLGDLSERKGFPEVLAAWPEVRRAVPDARLLVIGRGEGVERALALAGADYRVTALIDPPRAEIARRLRSAKVLVLPSRRRPLWREQVGLPIAEGLANGCLVVTTTETGIAAWLQQHEHWVLPEPAVGGRLVEALVAAVTSSRSAGDVQAALPLVDGREAAQRWLHRPPDA